MGNATASMGIFFPSGSDRCQIVLVAINGGAIIVLFVMKRSVGWEQWVPMQRNNRQYWLIVFRKTANKCCHVLTFSILKSGINYFLMTLLQIYLKECLLIGEKFLIGNWSLPGEHASFHGTYFERLKQVLFYLIRMECLEFCMYLQNQKRMQYTMKDKPEQTVRSKC